MSRQIEQETRVEWSDSGHSSSESSSSSTECGSLERLERVLEEEELLERTSEVTKEPRAARTVCVWNTGFANVIPFRRALRSACIRREDGAIVGFDWEEDCVVEAHGVSERRLARIVTQITMVNQLVNGQIRFDVVCRSVALARWLVGAIDTLPAWNRWFGRLHIATRRRGLGGPPVTIPRTLGGTETIWILRDERKRELELCVPRLHPLWMGQAKSGTARGT